MTRHEHFLILMYSPNFPIYWTCRCTALSSMHFSLHYFFDTYIIMTLFHYFSEFGPLMYFSWFTSKLASQTITAHNFRFMHTILLTATFIFITLNVPSTRLVTWPFGLISLTRYPFKHGTIATCGFVPIFGASVKLKPEIPTIPQTISTVP
jgi:hypothetical protein